MKIIVDVMGGDNSPRAAVRGVYMAAQQWRATYILVGDKRQIEQVAREDGLDIRRFDIVHTESFMTMEDDPLSVVRAKSDSSMSVGLRLLAEGKGDAFISSGNTGALFTGATLIVRKVKGILRAGIGTVLPFQNPVLLLDTGANVVVTPENLEQFGAMGAAYMHKMYGIARPRVGLLNNGTEACKGTELQQAAYRLLSQNKSINFVGNVEGGTAPFDVCDVLVSDGFSGNIYLKCVEGVGKFFLKRVKRVFLSSPTAKLAALTLKKPLGEMKKEYDPSERGGAPILGISKPVIKAHGSSDDRAIMNAIRQAMDYKESEVIYDLADSARAFSERKKAEREQGKK